MLYTSDVFKMWKAISWRYSWQARRCAQALAACAGAVQVKWSFSRLWLPHNGPG